MQAFCENEAGATYPRMSECRARSPGCERYVELLTVCLLVDDVGSEIETETEFKAQLMTVDLANFASVREFVDKYETEMGRLDVLVENAALGPNLTTVPRTVDGWEST